MRIPPFELERWQSIWEHKVEINVAESGVEPMAPYDLLEPHEWERLGGIRLGYPQTNGSESLRERIAALYAGTGAGDVLVTAGCAEANFLAAWFLIEPGDELIVVEPNYLQLAGLGEGFGAVVKPWRLRESTAWQPDPDELDRLVTSRTRAIAVCNPNNPTGSLLEEATIARICNTAERVGAWILADEVYRGAEFDGVETPSFRGRYDRVLCTGGLSKAYALPGLRIGWIVAPAEAIEQLWSRRDYTTICPSVPGDRLATLALEPARRARILGRTRELLNHNYAVVRQWIDGCGSAVRHVPPRAGAMAWLSHEGCPDTERFGRLLLERKSVLLVPGEQLGVPGHFRIGFGGETDLLREALRRIDELLEEQSG